MSRNSNQTDTNFNGLRINSKFQNKINRKCWMTASHGISVFHPGDWVRCGQSGGRHETNKAQNTCMFVVLRVEHHSTQSGVEAARPEPLTPAPSPPGLETTPKRTSWPKNGWFQQSGPSEPPPPGLRDIYTQRCRLIKRDPVFIVRHLDSLLK